MVPISEETRRRAIVAIKDIRRRLDSKDFSDVPPTDGIDVEVQELLERRRRMAAVEPLPRRRKDIYE